MAQSKRFRRLRKAIKPYGLAIRATNGGHQGIFKGSRKIYSCANTPKNIHYAEHNTFHDLKKLGYIPKMDNSI